ncbi:LPS export ABC transporter periplasmic protein LptC [Vicingaceae bacterium]|nr:LPS export ABC transporter periplasmic protein LptC [Vicingaceae bacterium]
MTNTIKILSLLIPIVLAIGIFSGCKNDLNKIESLTSMDNLPIEVRKGVQLYYSQDARVSAMLEAETMERFVGEEEYTVMPDGIYLETYDSSMTVTSSLKADYGLQKTDDDLMEAKGNVRVVNEKGEKLSTDQLFWDTKKRQIYTDSYVKIITAEQIIEGDGLISNEDFSEYKIMKIRGIISLDDNE